MKLFKILEQSTKNIQDAVKVINDAVSQYSDDSDFIDWIEEGEGWVQSYDMPDLFSKVQSTGDVIMVSITLSGTHLNNYEPGDRGHHGTELDADSPTETLTTFKIKASEVPDIINDVETLIKILDNGSCDQKITQTISDDEDLMQQLQLGRYADEDDDQ